jgi:large subunit ribosomal protein L6
MEANMRTSRIGRLPIQLPTGVEVKEQNNSVTVSGKLGKLSMNLHRDVSIKIEDNEVHVVVESAHPRVRSLHGMTRAILNNMVTGVNQGFEKGLTLVGVGYKAAVQGNTLRLDVGKSHQVVMEIPATITAEIGKKPTEITLKSIDKELLGQFAADVIKQRPPEPYKGKGIRYTGQVIKLKAGKKAGK